MSIRRLWATTRLDLAHNLRRPLFWIWIAILALVSWGFSGGNMRIQSGDSDVGGVKAFITSEFAIAQILSVLILLLHSFFVAVGSGMSVLRDEELHVGPVLHATPLSPTEYVWGKFLAIMISFMTILAIHVLLMAFFNHITTDAAEAEFIGPFAWSNYLRPALIFGLPTIVFMAGATFWVGERFRRPILVFFTPVAVVLTCVFFLWGWSPSWMSEPMNQVLMFLDPTGHRWLRETWLNVDKGAEFYNTATVGMDGVLIGSRILLMFIGLLGVALTTRHFSASLRGKSWQPKGKAADGIDLLQAAQKDSNVAKPVQAPLVPLGLGSLGMRSGRPGYFSGLAAVTQIEFRELLHSPGMYLFIPLIVLETIGSATFNVGPFDTTPLNTPGSMAVQGMGILVGFVCLLLLFYTVESLRREEGTGLAPIHHSTPVRSSSILSGKALANALVGVLTIGAALLASLLVLAIQGVVPITIWPFVLVWCVILLPTFLLWSTFVSFLYCLVRNRYTTYALALGALMWTGYKDTIGELSWVTNWPLWSALRWSDMGVFELIHDELVYNRVLALTLTLFFTVLTVRFFPRRQLDATNLLLRLRPLPLLKGTLKLTPVIIPPIVVGLMLGAEIDAGFQGDATTERSKDYWRKNVATWTDSELPDLVGVELDLELFPEARSFEARGTYRLVNEHDHDLVVIPVTGGVSWRRPDSLDADEDSEGPLWFLNGERFETEDAAGLTLFRLPQPLAPGAELQIGFHHSGEVPLGATENGGGNMEFILPSGIVLTSFSPSIVPNIGYNDGVGVDEDNEYDAKEYPADHFEGVTRSLFGGSFAPYDVSMRVTAPEEYQINGVGVLKEESVENGKRTVLWETDSPVRFFNVVCGRWVEAVGKEGTSIFHHPEHTYNIPEMLEALDGSRKFYSEWFYPYPWEELKISEFP
ncbi:MAG: ABC-2 type transport system permease protein, partial [Candidatus Paceibacteria bacterium]